MAIQVNYDQILPNSGGIRAGSQPQDSLTLVNGKAQSFSCDQDSLGSRQFTVEIQLTLFVCDGIRLDIIDLELVMKTLALKKTYLLIVFD